VSNVEIEATLAICSSAPEPIANELAGLRAVGRYQLMPRPELAIIDVYLDLADHALRSRGFGLRVRCIDHSQLITLKGRPEDVAGGGRRREEIELTWSEDALNSIVERLAKAGLALVLPEEVFEWNDPLTVLSQMGFIAEHKRNTRRRPRDVTSDGVSTSVVAELVVDSVSFQFQCGDVRHHEIEIETKGEGGIVAMQQVSQELLARWPEALRIWDHGKRSTGKVVEALIAERGTMGLISATGDLVPEAYDLISSRLL
jgi:hypothetical protein